MNADGTGLRRAAFGDKPRWSPDGRWLAFAQARIWVMRPDGTMKHPVGNDQNGFSWSPDSTSLAYGGRAGVSVADVATGAHRVLVHSADAANPAWSPDGCRIAFVRDNQDGTSSVSVVALDGSKPHLVGPGTDETISWSPDSTRIAYGTSYFCGAVGDAAKAKVVVIDVSTARTVVAIHGIAGAAAGNASWSADGTRLVFERANTAHSCLDDGADVWVVSADGTGLSQVTQAFPYSGTTSPVTWWGGRSGVVPDPPLQTITGRLRARGPVGAPGVTPAVGSMYESLLPYSEGSALHVLDVDTGHDLTVQIPGVTAPVTAAITKAGLI